MSRGCLRGHEAKYIAELIAMKYNIKDKLPQSTNDTYVERIHEEQEQRDTFCTALSKPINDLIRIEREKLKNPLPSIRDVLEKGANVKKDLQKVDNAATDLQLVKTSITLARDEIENLLLSYGINGNTGIIVEKCHEEAKSMAKKMKASNETNQCYLK